MCVSRFRIFRTDIMNLLCTEYLTWKQVVSHKTFTVFNGLAESMHMVSDSDIVHMISHRMYRKMTKTLKTTDTKTQVYLGTERHIL